ncbi:acyltransferase family protein [Klebsiella pneumoniae]|uniref:acyltransferase family protein n=1 Tax=Klebsiella pneumoniae TaxID=573 RepID=UPI000DE63BEE|nr:acyltransferase [Klebsiella pneumoniae]SSJ99990.1 Acyltransferase family [Klebsiella pneumoniae]HBY3995476.1 acyltransferase [Klebsiella pneumoniae]HBZ0705145.1 acyltransferase [Klebsiella pneumoniae]HEN5200898.1 acyltransferase [Klebsiella pneumoniae]
MTPHTTNNHSGNFFDVTRHVAALMVILSHHFAFLGLEEPHVNESIKLGSFAVLIFFSISGYLITKSKVNSSSNISYIKKRVLRIWPGLIACAFFTTYIVCGLLGNKDFFDWSTSFQALKTFFYYSFLGSHASDIQSNFFSAGFIFPSSVNSSLWTLLFEVLDYVMVLILFSMLNNKLASVLFFVGSAGVFFINYKLNISGYYLSRLASLSIPFSIGSMLYTFREHWEKGGFRYLIVLLGIALFALSIKYCNQFEWNPLTLFATPLIIVPLCMCFNDLIIKGRFDFSYGIYVYAFPVQQAVVNLITDDFFSSLIISSLITIALAMCSWFFIESVFLKRKKASSEIPAGIIPQ